MPRLFCFVLHGMGDRGRVRGGGGGGRLIRSHSNLAQFWSRVLFVTQPRLLWSGDGALDR